MALTDKYETSNIQLINIALKDKLIGLFLCLRDLAGKPSRKGKTADSLFSNMIYMILPKFFGLILHPTRE